MISDHMRSKEYNHIQRQRKFGVQEVPLELVIWDNDGTLFRTAMQYWIASATAMVQEYRADFPNQKLPTEKDIASKLVHDPNDVADFGLSPEKTLAYAEDYRQYAVNLLGKNPPKYHGVQQELLRLKKQGIQLAVATSAIRPWLEASLSALGIHGLFDYTITQDEVGHDGLKPKPIQLLQIMEKLHVDPRRTAMIGDTSSDWGAGNNAGVGTNVAMFYPKNRKTNPCRKIDQFQEKGGKIDATVYSLEHAVSFLLARRVITR